MHNRRHQAAAIRKLWPCCGNHNEFATTYHAEASCPEWGLQPLGLSHSQQQLADTDTVFSTGLQGQAVLALPFEGADVSLGLPPSLRVTATPAGHLDCHLQLLSLAVDWPATRHTPQDSTGQSAVAQHQPRVIPARSAAAGFACRSGALLLAHALFPDHSHNLLSCLAVPVVVADSIAAVAAAMPAAAQHAVQRQAGKLKHKLQGRRRRKRDTEGDSISSSDENGFGWVDGVQGLAEGSLHTLRCLSGPAAALASVSWLWSLVSPSSHALCAAMTALLAVAADYNGLGRDIARGKIRPGKDVEAAWRARHKAAAQRLAVYLNDLPASPPLQPVVQLLSHCSIAAGLAIDGQGLTGHLSPGLSLSGPVRTTAWGLSGQPGATACSADGAGRVQLQLCGSMQLHTGAAGAAVHEAAGLSRSQLLELFTGSSTDPLAADAAAPGGSSCYVHSPASADRPPADAAIASSSSQAADPTGSKAQQQQQLSSVGTVSSSRNSTHSALNNAVTPPTRTTTSSSSSSIGSSPAAVSAAAGLEAAVGEAVDAIIRVERHPGYHKRPTHRACSSSSSAWSDGSDAASDAASTSSDVQILDCAISPDGNCSTSCPSTDAAAASLVPGQPATSYWRRLWQGRAARPGAAAQAEGGIRVQADAGTVRAAAAITTSGATAPGRSAAADPLAFLDDLPLYGQQDHHHLLATAAGDGLGDDSASITAAAAAAAAAGGRSNALRPLAALHLGLRMVYLLLVFAPFLLLGVPMLLVSWWLLSRAAAMQQHRVTSLPSSTQGSSPEQPDSSSSAAIEAYTGATTVPWQQRLIRLPAQALLQLLRQLGLLLAMLCVVLDLLLVLVLGGHWAAGISAWESAGMYLKRKAWQLLLFSCSRAGAAFIKWGQWSSSRRDIFPADFCDVLSTLHDRAPVHSFRHTRRQITAAFGADIDQLFDSFDSKPLASGSIAQVHRARLLAHSSTYTTGQQQQQQPQQQPPQQQPCEVVVKVCHPNVAEHIRMNFKLLSWLSAAAARLPMLRGLSIRESVAQFSHTMTAQTDLRVEAVHALRFYNNFAGVKSSVSIPRPIPGLVSSQVLVETFEEGRSVAAFMREPHPINTQIVALGVDAYLKMLLYDNFVHTDLHPGNILFRTVPAARQAGQIQSQHRQQRTGQQQQQQQGQQLLVGPADKQHQSRTQWWRFWKQPQPTHVTTSSSTSSSGGGIICQRASPVAAAAVEPHPQWEQELEQMIAQHQTTWVSKHGSKQQQQQQQINTMGGTPPAGLPGADTGCPAGGAPGGAPAAQLVLLDFGLAEQLTPEVRRHFISFLNAISAGNGLAAARHLLCWSHNQACSDRQAFATDVVDLFNAACDIHSADGIDLDHVMKSVLGLARKHGVSIDSCYASLVISVCVLVGFAKALDPAVNLMDAATPTLLAYALTGKVVGRLYS